MFSSNSIFNKILLIVMIMCVNGHAYSSEKPKLISKKKAILIAVGKIKKNEKHKYKLIGVAEPKPRYYDELFIKPLFNVMPIKEEWFTKEQIEQFKNSKKLFWIVGVDYAVSKDVDIADRGVYVIVDAETGTIVLIRHAL